jgi:hypothetical protein
MSLRKDIKKHILIEARKGGHPYSYPQLCGIISNSRNAGKEFSRFIAKLTNTPREVWEDDGFAAERDSAIAALARDRGLPYHKKAGRPKVS